MYGLAVAYRKGPLNFMISGPVVCFLIIVHSKEGLSPQVT